MLQVQTLPASLAGLVWAFRWCFTEPSFRTFATLLAGMIAQPGRRTVCGMLVGAGAAGVWHHSRAHWFFTRARWSTDQVGLVLARLIVDRLLPPGAVPADKYVRAGQRASSTSGIRSCSAPTVLVHRR